MELIIAFLKENLLESPIIFYSVGYETTEVPRIGTVIAITTLKTFF